MKIKKLLVEHSGVNSYTVKTYFNPAAIPGPTDIYGEYYDQDKEYTFIVGTNDPGSEFIFHTYPLSFSAYGRHDMLRIIIDKTEHAGVTIRDTNYPPPYPRPQEELFTPEDISSDFTIERLECQHVQDDEFEVTIKMYYSSRTTLYTIRGLDLVKRPLSSSEYPHLIMYVNKDIDNNPHNGTLDFGPCTFRFGNADKQGLPVIVTTDNPGQINWDNIMTKKAFFIIF